MEITLFFLAMMQYVKWNQFTQCMAHCFRNDVKWVEVLAGTKLTVCRSMTISNSMKMTSFFKRVENTVGKGQIALY